MRKTHEENWKSFFIEKHDTKETTTIYCVVLLCIFVFACPTQAQFGDISNDELFPRSSLFHVNSPHLDNLAIQSIMRVYLPSGNCFDANKTVVFRYKYNTGQFSDETNWQMLLDFIPTGKDLNGFVVHQASDYDQKDYNQILKAVFTFKKTNYKLSPPAIPISNESLHCTVSEKKILRQIEVFLVDIKPTIRLLPEQPPRRFSIAPNYGDYPNDPRSMDLGAIDITTSSGNFQILLSFPMRLTSRETTDVEYPFYSWGIAAVINEVLSREIQKTLPQEIFKEWSGEKRIQNEISLFQELNSTVPVQQLSAELKAEGEPPKPEQK
ncbi:MAG: hypothetical protein ACRCUY_09195 [Thermoguttaceae bacterium]